MNVNFFKHIIIPPPTPRIYARLGYSQSKTKLNQQQKDEIEKYIQEALTFIELKGSAIRIPINKINKSKTTLQKGIIFKSKDLVKLFANSKEILIMGATAGNNIMKAIKDNSRQKDLTRAVIFDAVASEIVDDVLPWIINYYNRELARENKHLTKRRFSAGYGDFALENQKTIYNTLKMKQLGVTLTKNYILIPEKSVTAVAGIEISS